MTVRIAARAFTVLALLVLAPHSALAAEGGGSMELVWQGVNLAIIVGVLYYFGRRPIAEFFASRREQIKTDLDSAADLLSQAELRNSEIQRRLAELDAQVEELRETSRRRADEESERILAEARKSAERIRNDATAAAEQELQRARRELRAEAAELAVKLAGELLERSVGDADRERLLDEFITRVEPGPGAPN